MSRSRYSFIEHLAMSVLFSRYSDRAPMTFSAAYFDASGHPDNPSHRVMTVAGFVSTVKKWTRFEIEWKAILRREGIKFFHMTDFVSSQGEFAVGWKGATDRRRIFINDLAACLVRNVNKSFRATLVLGDYNKVNKMFALEETLGRPYQPVVQVKKMKKQF